MLDKPEVLAGVTKQPRFPPWEFDTQNNLFELGFKLRSVPTFKECKQMSMEKRDVEIKDLKIQ